VRTSSFLAVKSEKKTSYSLIDHAFDGKKILFLFLHGIPFWFPPGELDVG
jgi:hypothetical protein